MTDEKFEAILRFELDKVRMQATQQWKDLLGWEDWFTAGAYAARKALGAEQLAPRRGQKKMDPADFDKYDRVLMAIKQIGDARMSPGMIKAIVTRTLHDVSMME